MIFQQKQAHYDKVCRSNYLASLSIEGFETTRADAQKPLSSRMEVVEKYRQKSD
nr:YhfG family protein [Pseudomonas atagonensis]